MSKFQDLNTIGIRTDTDLEAPQLDFTSGEQDYSYWSPDSEHHVFFKNIEARLIEQIRGSEYVFGCVAWLTNPRILAALAQCKGVAFVVQKEDFLRPDGVNKSELHQLYDRLPSVIRYGFDGRLRHMSIASDPYCEGVRCMGYGGNSRTKPRMHHKFAVFCKASPVAATPDGCPYFYPYAVWTGSYNWTNNATRSLENAVLVRNPGFANQFLHEFQQVSALSEPLDWESESVEPQWRIGT